MKFKFLAFLFGCLSLLMVSTTTTFAQGETEEDDEASDYEIETVPTNSFIKLSLGINTVNASVGEVDFQFWDDGFPTDSIATIQQINNLWAYGGAFDFTYLMKGNFTLNVNNFFGLGNDFFNYVGQVALGYEYITEPFIIQPSLGVGFVYSEYRFGTYFPVSKQLFQIDGNSTFDLRAKLMSHAFAVSPSVYIEYPLKNKPNLSIFAKVTGFYTFGRYSYITLSGETEFLDEDGDPIRERTTRQLSDNSILLSINDTRINDRKSSNLNYNFNSLLIQFGISVRLNSYEYEE